MGSLLRVAKKAKTAADARNGECQVCGKKIRGGARKGNTCSVACAQFIAMSW